MADADFEAWAKDAQQIQQQVDREDIDASELETLRAELSAKRSEFEEERNKNGAQIATVEEQIKALGPPPEEGGTENAAVAERREQLNEQLAELRAPGLRAEEAVRQTVGLIGQIDSRIRERESARILSRGSSPLTAQFWANAYSAIEISAKSIARDLTVADPDSALAKPRREALPAALAAALCGMLLIWRGPRVARVVGAWGRDMTRRGTGVWSVVISLIRVLLPVLGVVLLTFAILEMGLIAPPTADLVALIPVCTAIVLIYNWLAWQIFPDNGQSPLNIPERAHPILRRLTRTAAILVCIRLFLLRANEVYGWPDGAIDAWQLPVALFMGAALWQIAKNLYVSGGENEEDDDSEAGFSRYLLNLLSRAVKLIAIAGPVLTLIGYFNAGNMLLFRTETTLLLGAVLVVLQIFWKDLWVLITGDETSRDSLVPTLLGFAMAIPAIPLLALTWGARWAELLEVWQKFQGGFRLGETRISPDIFATFLVVFAIGYMITRLLQGALRSSILPKTRIDRGGQNAIVSGTGYIGIFIAALVAITTAGIDLSGLAIVAGALSVGIGFGLQNVVSNFVSGIILLIERPIGIGDWIEVGDRQGYVRSISVRSTKIETFERSELIIPNADLVSGQVTNFTLGNTVGRLTIPVGVAYGSDTRRVEQILLDIPSGMSEIMSYPAPYVVFSGFGASTYDMELRVYLRDVGQTLSVRTEINHRIREAFEKEQIEIAFPQQDIWFRNAVPAPEPEPEPGAGQG